MYLRELLTDIEYNYFNGEPETEVTSIAYDSRRVEAGALFVCLRGGKHDGHDFVPQAMAAGAAAVVVERRLDVDVPLVMVENTRKALAELAASFYGYPSQSLRLTGVTGTNGKTTTTYLLYSIFEYQGMNVALLGTNGVRTREHYRALPLTTPESVDLQQTMRELAREGIEHLAMEVSSHALVQHRVDGCEFDTAVFTNLSHDHLDFHGNMEAYREAKAQLFDKQKGLKLNKHAILNADDRSYAYLRSRINVPVYTYALKEKADFRALNMQNEKWGTRFQLQTPEGTVEVRLHLQGRFNVYNALAAAAAARAEGVPMEAIVSGLQQLSGVPGRMERFESAKDFQIYIDFAHTPDSLENVLQTLHSYQPHRLITVFGCPGNRDKEKRPLMGRIAERYSDIVVLTADNPADEEPLQIIAEIKAGMQGDPLVILDRREAVNHTLSLARPGDIVLLAGKGHETYQIVGDRTIPYSEREVIADYFFSG